MGELGGFRSHGCYTEFKKASRTGAAAFAVSLYLAGPHAVALPPVLANVNAQLDAAVVRVFSGTMN